MAKKKVDTGEEAAIGANQFSYGDKTYNVLKAAIVPLGNGAVKMTAADICVDTQAQQYLVENNASCLQEAE